MYNGKCLCGEVAVEIRGEISSIIHCHCSVCRKSSGTAYATNGFVSKQAFKVLQGEQVLSCFSSVAGSYKYFCSQCGSPVYSANDKAPDRIRIRLGIIESDITERPISHNFVTSKANWENLDAHLPRYNSYEPGRK